MLLTGVSPSELRETVGVVAVVPRVDAIVVVPVAFVTCLGSLVVVARKPVGPAVVVVVVDSVVAAVVVRRVAGATTAPAARPLAAVVAVCNSSPS